MIAVIQCILFVFTQIGANVEVKHPDTGRVMEASIKQMSDSSMYTVGKHWQCLNVFEEHKSHQGSISFIIKK